MNTSEIKEAYSMLDILDRYGIPRPNRSGYIRCPFHEGDRQPSMKIYQKDFHCYACGANGDIFTFVMLMDDISFQDAFRELGGVYEHSFSAKLKIYRAQKQREMLKKQQGSLQKKRQLNNLLISVYMRWADKYEPLSDAWCCCQNALQIQLYLHERLNDPEGEYETIKRTERKDNPFG